MRCAAKIGELVREEGTTAVIVSHDPQSASIADRIVRVRDGRVSEEAARADGNGEAIVVGRAAGSACRRSSSAGLGSEAGRQRALRVRGSS
jgi:ABC-type sulfate/molybdate transport systems ATPase subunit